MKTTNLTAEIRLVTPQLAKNLLTFNKKNRTATDEAVDFLAKQMQKDLFLENGESIVFDNNGELKDGQHRLLAIIKSGKSYFIPIVRGVKPNVMATFDTGKNRSAGDVLKLNGFHYNNLLAAAINGIYKWSIKGSTASTGRGSKKGRGLTNQQILDYCSNNYDWLYGMAQKTQNIIHKAAKPKVMSMAEFMIITHMIGGETPSESVYEFMRNIVGAAITPDTAASYIFTKMNNAKINKEPLNFYWKLGMILKAWNYYADGNPAVKYFKFSVDMKLPKINSYKQVA